MKSCRQRRVARYVYIHVLHGEMARFLSAPSRAGNIDGNAEIAISNATVERAFPWAAALCVQRLGAVPTCTQLFAAPPHTCPRPCVVA